MRAQPRRHYPGVNRGWTRRCGDAGVVTPYACPRVHIDDRPPPAADEGRRRAAPRGGQGARGPPRPSAKTPPARPAHPVSPSSIPPPHERPVTTRAWRPHRCRRRRPVLSPRAGAFRVARCKIAPTLRPFSHLPCYLPRADCSRFPSTGPRHTRSGPCRACVQRGGTALLYGLAQVRSHSVIGWGAYSGQIGDG